MMIDFIYLHVLKMYVCDMLMVYETNSNLTHSEHMSHQLDYKFLEHVCMLCCQIAILTILLEGIFHLLRTEVVPLV